MRPGPWVGDWARPICLEGSFFWETYLDQRDCETRGESVAWRCVGPETCGAAGAGDLVVRVDPSQLHQVLWNLCDNAVKYASETGGILVELHAGRVEAQGRPYLEVRDHGLGVDPATAEQIFEPFFTARSGGTGLGLYISRELCELNRATLLYLDRPGGGSIFRIVFSDPDRWDKQD